jgi:hypothetical protein
MGNSSSAEITNTIENRNINLSMIESINKNVSEIITNTVVSNHTSAQSGTTQVGEIVIDKIYAIGPGSDISGLLVLIDQNAQIQFNSNDKSIQNNNIMVDYALKLVQQLQNSISNDQAAKLASEAQASQENGFLSTAMGNSVRSDVNNQIKNINENKNLTKILNQVTNTIQQNSQTLTFKECIMSNLQSGRFKIGEIIAQDGGKIQNITLGIKQTLSVIQNCVFETLQKSDITTKITQDFGFTVTNDTANKQTAESDAKATSTQKNMGLSLESLLSSIISSVLIIVVIVLVFILKFSLKKDAKNLMQSGQSGQSGQSYARGISQANLLFRNGTNISTA